MQSMVKVWNDHPTDYSEKFQDTVITIPGKKYVEMDYYEAVQFLGQFIKPIKLGDGTFANHKMLRIEGKAPIPDSGKPKCHLCKGEFESEEALMVHSDRFHRDLMVQEKAPKVDAKGR